MDDDDNDADDGDDDDDDIGVDRMKRDQSLDYVYHNELEIWKDSRSE